MPVRPGLARVALLACGMALAPTLAPARSAGAQQAEGTAGAVAVARRLREEGDLAGAAQFLRERLEADPGDGDARRLLAETLYWLRDFAAARAEYERGMAMHPADRLLRLQYGRMLVETGDGRRAREVLEPLREADDVRAGASTLLGTLEYWNGDYTGASRHFRDALRADPAREDARRQLREITLVTAPWLTLGGDVRRDDQPIDALAATMEAGWYITPNSALELRARPSRLAPEDADAASVGVVDLAFSAFAPSVRLETELSGGAVMRSFGTASDWIGSAGLGLRLPGHVTARVRGARAPYLYTVASLETPVMTRTVSGIVHWEHPRGWLGETAVVDERYPDDNAVRTAYAWLLAPLVRGERGALRVGYAFTAQDARETRFVRDSAPRPGRPNPSSDPNAGRYDPYFTPEDLRVQALLAEASVRATRAIELRVSGDYGFDARDEAPMFVTAPTVPPGNPPPTDAPSFQSRTFTPWTARGRVSADLSPDVRLSLSMEHGRTVYYEWTSAGIQLTWRFTAGALRQLP